jgi:hypothetical protein
MGSVLLDALLFGADCGDACRWNTRRRGASPAFSPLLATPGLGANIAVVENRAPRALLVSPRRAPRNSPSS